MRAKRYETETLNVRISKYAKERLIADAAAHRTTPGRRLMDCWVDTLTKEEAMQVLHKMPKRKLMEPTKEVLENQCPKCSAIHPAIPALGPWHTPACPDYMKRSLHYR